MILEHHSEINGETLKFFARTVEGWLAADTWEAYLVGRLRERSNSGQFRETVSSGAVCPSYQCLEADNVHNAGNTVQLSKGSDKGMNAIWNMHVLLFDACLCVSMCTSIMCFARLIHTRTHIIIIISML